ncbi:MAG: hypothetical protein U5L95_05010 [Candidatus Saccharibacteria bacterium]|nr:hypothetical protein [Candidatus Saccharibacteria bacterium]
MAKDTQRKLSGKQIAQKVGQRRKAVFERFPLVFTMLGAFGLAATIYGFEGILDEVDLFADNPWILLGTGIITLAFTGTLYKRLQ